MSLIKKSTTSLSSNDKVMHYLQNSTTNLFFIPNHRLNYSSDNDSLSSSFSSVLDSLSRSDFSSDVSDPIAHSSIISSNISSDEDLDFNIGFDQISDDDQDILNENNANAVTLLGESALDERINEIEEYLHQASDETITNNYTKQQRCASFLHDSTYTLCSQDRFSSYTEDGQENEQITGYNIRSNSFTVLQLAETTTVLEKAPKKVVRFADMLGLDLESVRYMTPPDQTTTSIIQECLRLQLGQLRFTKNQLELPNLSKRSSSPTKHYNLVSKNFIPPINIIPGIYDKKILLECLYTKESTTYGTIRVHNCSYNKNVFVHSTEDEWKTSNNIQALHLRNCPHDNTDTYTFEINLSNLTDDLNGPKRILFAVCLQAMNQEFWDNNQGWNYVLDVFERR